MSVTFGRAPYQSILVLWGHKKVIQSSEQKLKEDRPAAVTVRFGKILAAEVIRRLIVM